MNESSVSEYTRKKLIERGFMAIKFNDNSTTGIPDMFIAKNGKGMWVEDKFLSITTGIKDEAIKAKIFRFMFKARSFISKDRQIQMINMIKLENKFHNARYWIYIENHGVLWIAQLSPREVFTSFKYDTVLEIVCVRADEWRREFEL